MCSESALSTRLTLSAHLLHFAYRCRTDKIPVNDSRFSSRLFGRRLSDYDGTPDSFRCRSGFLISRRSRPLRSVARAYFPTKYKFSVPLVTLFISDVVINFITARRCLIRKFLCRYVALALVGCIGLRLQNRAIAENAFAGFPRRIGVFLRHHKCVFLAERSRLREKFCGTYSGADGRTATIQRHADAGCFSATRS